MSEMIERVALAIEKAAISAHTKGLKLARISLFPSEARYLAEAAINEMRVPTEEMIVAMHDGAMGGYGEEMGEAQRQYVVDCWADMIVAAGAGQ